MTPSAPPPQDLAAATFRGWGELTTAWIAAAERWWATIVEWAYDECAYNGPNQTTSFTTVDDATPLRGDFYRVAGASQTCIPHASVKIGRTTDAALAAAGAPHAITGAPSGEKVLVISIRPGPAVPPGGYRGEVVDASTGALVAGSLYVLVATST